jgi:hypothetical protein
MFRKITTSLLLALTLALAGCGGDKKDSAKTGSAAATLTVAQATVEYRSSGSDTWTATGETQTATTGDSIRTDATGQATLTFYTGTEVEIDPQSELVVTQFDQAANGSQTILLKQLAGDTVHHVARLADAESRYEVETPVATMTVRGTEFSVAVAPDGATHIEVREGTVQAEVQTPTGRQTIEIGVGKALDVNQNREVPSTPYPIPAIRVPDATATPSVTPTGAASPTATRPPADTATPPPTRTSEATAIPPISIGGTPTPSGRSK